MFTSALCTPGAVCSAARPHGEDPLRRHTGEATVSNAGLKHTRTTLTGMNTRAGRAGARPGAPEALRPRARPVEGAGCLRPPRPPHPRPQAPALSPSALPALAHVASAPGTTVF